MKLREWEYEDFDADSHNLRFKLNELGRDGWEAYHLEKIEYENSDYSVTWKEISYIIYAKREVSA